MKIKAVLFFLIILFSPVSGYALKAIWVEACTPGCVELKEIYKKGDRDKAILLWNYTTRSPVDSKFVVHMQWELTDDDGFIEDTYEFDRLFDAFDFMFYWNRYLIGDDAGKKNSFQPRFYNPDILYKKH
jgi:hypothetical protein